MGANKSFLLPIIYINKIVKIGNNTYLKVVNKLYSPIPLNDSELIFMKDIGNIDKEIKTKDWLNNGLFKKTDSSPLIKKIKTLIKIASIKTSLIILR